MILDIDQILSKMADTLVRNIDHIDDVGMLYGKGAANLFLFHYSSSQQNDRLIQVSLDLLNKMNETFSMNLVVTYPHTASLACYWHHLNNKGLISVDSNTFFTEIDSFLLESVEGSRSTNLKLTNDIHLLKYLFLRLTEANVNPSFQLEDKLIEAGTVLLREQSRKFVELSKKPEFWRNDSSLSYYEHELNTHTLFNFLTCIMKPPAINLLRSEIKKTIESLIDELEKNFYLILNPDVTSYRIGLYYLYTLDCYNSLYKSPAIQNKTTILYNHLRGIFSSFIEGEISNNSLILCLQLYNRIRENRSFDFENESTTLLNRLIYHLEERQSNYTTYSEGIPNMGLAEGIAGQGLVLLNCTNQIDSDWDEFMFYP